MSDQESLSPEEISRRITAGMGLVYDLFKELHSLFRMIYQGLRDSEADLHVIPWKMFMLPRNKKGTTIADRFLHIDMGLLAELGVSASLESEDDLDTADESEEIDVETDKTAVAITPDSQYLAVRAVVYDPSVPADKFTPALVAVVFSSITRQPLGKKAKAGGETGIQDSFQLKRTILKRLIKQLQPSLKPGQTISARVTKALLGAKVVTVEVVPLGEFNSQEKVSEFVDRLVTMAEAS